MTTQMTEERRNEIRRMAGLPVYKKSVDTFCEQDARDLAELEAKMADRTKNPMHPEDYYRMKHFIRELRAKRAGMESWQYDPMGYAFDMQSN